MHYSKEVGRREYRFWHLILLLDNGGDMMPV